MASVSGVHACHKDCQASESLKNVLQNRTHFDFSTKMDGSACEIRHNCSSGPFLFKLTIVLCIYDLCRAACPVPRAHSHRLPDALLSGFRIERMMSVEQLAASTLPVA